VSSRARNLQQRTGLYTALKDNIACTISVSGLMAILIVLRKIAIIAQTKGVTNDHAT